MLRKHPNELVKRSITITALVFFFGLIFWHRDTATSYLQEYAAIKGSTDRFEEIDLPKVVHNSHLPCANLPGADDVLVIVKTGYNVAHKRLPMHIESTYRCIPNLYIYSDAEDEVNGHKIHDALAELDPEMTSTHEDFSFWRKVKEHQQKGLGADDLTTKDDNDDAWRLDKWKNIPLLVKAHEHMPNAKWYVFIDADTYPVWSNMLHWLSKKSYNKRIYLGCQAYMGDLVFGHGGSGYILSQAAMKFVLAEMNKDLQHYYQIPEHECCGDVAVAVILRDYLDLNLTASWPMIQGETPETLDYTLEKWCKTVVTYHHVDPDQVDALWRFEQHWLRWMNEQDRVGKTDGLAPPILHRDIFDYFVSPLIQKPLTDWDNMSKDRILKGRQGGNEEEEEDETKYEYDEEKVAHTSYAACRKACEVNGGCMGYSHSPGECRLSWVIRLGVQANKAELIRSGWMLERFETKRKEWDICEDDGGG